LQIGGFINNLGNLFAVNTGTITMNGTLPQILPANTFTNGNTIFNLVTDNLTGVSLGGDISISNMYTLTNGLLTTGNNLLVINNTATTTGASATRYVKGNVRKVGNQAFSFPVGMGGRYAPISISAPTNSTDHFTASYVANDPDPMYPTSSLGAGLNKVSRTEYWQLNRTNGNSNVEVTLSFDQTRSGGITTLADLRVAGWNGTQWINHGNTGTTGNAGNNPNGTVKSNPALAVFGPFTLGSSTANNTLPISLLSFSAQLQNNNTTLAWETTNEINASHFNVQRSTGAGFNTVGKVNTVGGGNYAYTDNIATLTPTTSSVLYRLQMVDNDGSFTYSKTVAVTPNATTKSIRIFPNPVRETLFIQVTSTKTEKLTLQVIDLQGKLLQQQTQQVTAGTTSLSFNTAALAKGNYVLVVKGSAAIQQKQFVKQ
jgi:hypothetical protein